MADGTAPDASIVLFGDGRDWHGKSLLRAFKKRGLTPLLVPLDACGFSTETASGLAIPGLGDRLPEGAFVRFVPGGTFEEVTLYLGVLHALHEHGVVVWNDARAIERCVDKSTTTFFLQREGLPTPRTFTCVDALQAAAIAARVLDEGFFAFLQRDRVDDALALQALEAGFDHAPLRRINHYRHARDVGLGRDQLQDLLARDVDGLLVAVFLDQLAELRAAGDVGALADVDEQEVRRDDQRFEAGEACVAW